MSDWDNTTGEEKKDDAVVEETGTETPEVTPDMGHGMPEGGETPVVSAEGDEAETPTTPVTEEHPTSM